MNRRTRKKSAASTSFVPKSILRNAFLGVVPLVAAASQAGCAQTTGGGIVLAVIAFDGDGEAGTDATAQDRGFSVADVGFVNDAQPDAGPDVQNPPDQQIIVLAVIGFDADAGDGTPDGFGGG